MIEGIITFSKSNEFSVELRAGACVSSRKNRNTVKYMSAVPYQKILGPEMFEIQIFFWTIKIKYYVYIVHYIISPAGSGGSTNALIFLQQNV